MKVVVGPLTKPTHSIIIQGPQRHHMSLVVDSLALSLASSNQIQESLKENLWLGWGEFQKGHMYLGELPQDDSPRRGPNQSTFHSPCTNPTL